MAKKIAVLITLIYLMICCSYASAQNIEKLILGKVVDHEMQPVASATIQLYSFDQMLVSSATSDSEGKFSMKFSKPGKYFVQVSHIGHETLRSSMFEFSNIDLGILKIAVNENLLESVRVEGKKKNFEVKDGIIVYSVENSISAKDVSVLEALKGAPGVYVENESNISLNGKGGVQVLLDGRQIFLSGKELIDLLKSLPSNNLKSIEIINSPSAKHDASGSAGIINIVTKKQLTTGLNGNVSSTVAYGISPKQLQNIALNYRVNSINVFGNYSHTLGNYNYIYGTNRQQNGKSYDSHTDDVDKRQKMNAQVGMDYYLNDKNTISFLASSNFIFGGGITDTHTEISALPSTSIEESLDATNDYYGQSTARYNFNLNYKFEDSLGRSFTIDADYALFDKWNKNLQSNIYRDNTDIIIQQNYNRTLNDIDIDMKGIKLDYALNLWKGKLETGLKYTHVGSKNSSQFYHVHQDIDSLDNRRSNNFHFDEHTSSAYIDYKRSLGKWSLQGGLRLEHSNSQGSLIDLDGVEGMSDKITRRFTNLFPFLSATRRLNEHQNFSISYSKRIERPAYQDLNPFIYMLDELSFWQGNPFLSPSLTHRLTMLYSLKSSTIITLNYAYTDQFTAKVTDTLDTEKIVIISKNLGTQKHLSLALTQNFAPKPWWDITFNGLLYYIHNDVSFDQYRNLNLRQVAGRVSLVQSFHLPYQFKAEITSMYNSKRLSGANTISQPVSQVDVALQKTIFKDKATLRLAVSDIYKGNQSRYTQNFPGFTSSSYGYFESRQVRFSFSYRFSSGVTKAQRTSKSALENESRRIN
ncbi:outer membrane beta-barrel protein [Sphingobacterium hungaricum]